MCGEGPCDRHTPPFRFIVPTRGSPRPRGSAVHAAPSAPEARVLTQSTPEVGAPTLKRFQCPSCDYATKHKPDLVRHTARMHTPAGEEKFQCPSCDYATSHKPDLVRHTAHKHTPAARKRGRSSASRLTAAD